LIINKLIENTLVNDLSLEKLKIPFSKANDMKK